MLIFLPLPCPLKGPRRDPRECAGGAEKRVRQPPGILQQHAESESKKQITSDESVRGAECVSRSPTSPLGISSSMSQGRDWLTDLRKDPGKPRIQCGPLHLSGQEVSLRLPNPISLSAHCYKTALKNNPSKTEEGRAPKSGGGGCRDDQSNPTRTVYLATTRESKGSC